MQLARPLRASSVIAIAISSSLQVGAPHSKPFRSLDRSLGAHNLEGCSVWAIRRPPAPRLSTRALRRRRQALGRQHGSGRPTAVAAMARRYDSVRWRDGAVAESSRGAVANGGSSRSPPTSCSSLPAAHDNLLARGAALPSRVSRAAGRQLLAATGRSPRRPAAATLFYSIFVPVAAAQVCHGGHLQRWLMRWSAGQGWGGAGGGEAHH